MSQRFLRKTDGDPYLYPWTEALSKRKDMQEVLAPGEALPLDEAAVGDELDELDTVAALREFATQHGVDLPETARSKAAIRAAIREAAAQVDATEPAEGEPL